MFKRIVNFKGFWKAVVTLAFAYTIILFIVQWAFAGFTSIYFSLQNIIVAVFAGFIVGFFMAYGKFWGKLKSEDYKK